jgi:hypothetical protein
MNYEIKNKTLEFIRVPYGKDDTPQKLREYKLKDLGSNSPVGTIDEIVNVIFDQDLDEVDMIVFEEKTGEKRTYKRDLTGIFIEEVK